MNTESYLIIGRHAEKAISPVNDPILTDRGKRQAVILAQELSPWLQQGGRIICSQARRTQMTGIPLADALSLEIAADVSLNQRAPQESLPDFQARLLDFKKQVIANELLLGHSCYLITHIDSAAELIRLIEPENLPADFQWHLPSAAYAIFSFDGESQSLKFQGGS